MSHFAKSTSLVLLVLLATSLNVDAVKPKVEKCKLCTDLIDNFIKGLKRTSKGNFGGGNTDWEDRKLGNYLFSETRFEEILENICSEHECHKLLEEYEEELFDWFKNKQNRIESDLHASFCIEARKHCCPRDTFGASCAPCKRNYDSVCSGRGNCDGEGTRAGTGKCSCHHGYAGDLCDQCNNGFYESDRTEKELTCTVCHQACESCTGPSHSECQACKTGYKMNEDSKTCEDVNECLTVENACKMNEFCENTNGSHVCYECDPACKTCTGKGADHCLECARGYRGSGSMFGSHVTCQDINECEEEPRICPEEQKCVNTPGSFICDGGSEEEDLYKQAKAYAANSVIQNERILLIKRALITGITLLCAIGGYYARQYILVVFSVAFGIILNLTID